MAVILGINAFHAGAAAALVVDGRPVVAMAEERLNRVKYFAGFPRLAILRCLEYAHLALADVDAVAVGRDAAANRARKIGFALQHPSRFGNFARMRRRRQPFDALRQLVAAECGVDEAALSCTVHPVEHHLAHTASAYFASAWDHCASITVDGSGDFVTCLLSECRDDTITPVQRLFVPHSLGTVYTAVCQFIGYPHYGDEGKVMGLAPLGTDTYRPFFERMIRATATGFALNPAYFVSPGEDPGLEISPTGEMIVHRLFSDLFIRELGEPRPPGAAITERDKNLAFGLQRLFEEHYLALLHRLHEAVPVSRLAMAGGCVLNSVANGKALAETPFTEHCIQPAAGDDGLALGAALYVSNSVLKERKRWHMTDAFLGDDHADDRIEAELTRLNVPCRRLTRQDLLDLVSDELRDGSVVGWFQGRMEWGPRALGNRSILAHPGYPGMKDILNARIKHREAFRPFAPAVLAERQDEIFEQREPSPFMLHVCKIRPEWRDRLTAVTHVDDTGRLQTVTRAANPLFYDLIAAFSDKTGIPVLLNTSFNENEPIVCTPAEAIDCYLRTRMDALAIGSFLCRKSAPPS